MGARSKNNSASPRFGQQTLLLVALLLLGGIALLYASLPSSPTGLVVFSDNATFTYDGPQQIVFSSSATMDLSPYFSRGDLTYVATTADGVETTIEGDVLRVVTNATFGEFNISVIGAVSDEVLSVPLTFLVDGTQELTPLAQPLATVVFETQDETGVGIDEPAVDVQNRIVRFSHEPVDLVGIESSAELVNVTPFATTIVARIGRASTPSYLRTDVFAVNAVTVGEAKITLAKRGDVTSIYRCADFDTDLFNCNGAWMLSGLPFEQNETHVSFVATEFSGYAGGGEASSASTQGAGFETQGGFTTQGPISACGTLIENSTLTQDVTADGTCFTIAAHGLTLDCAGFKITYSTSQIGYGVNITGFHNATVHNCTIIEGAGAPGSLVNAITLFSSSNSTISFNRINTTTTLARGIQAAISGSNHLITNNVIYVNGSTALTLSAVTNSTIIENNITGNLSSGVASGISLSEANRNTLINNIVRSGSTALSLQGLDNVAIGGYYESMANSGISIGDHNNTVREVTGVSNGSSGITATQTSSRHRIIQSNGTSNASTGITIDTAANVTIINSTASSTSGTAMIIQGSRNTTIINTTARSITGVAITTSQNSANNTFFNFVAQSTTGIAWSWTAQHNTLVSNSTIISNNSIGLSMQTSFNNTITHSAIFSNGSSGVQISTHNNTFINNNITSILGRGIRTLNTFNNTYRDNLIQSKSFYALGLFGTNGSMFSGNTFISMTDNGVNLQQSYGNIFANNTFSSNDSGAISIEDNSRNNTFINSTLYTNNSWIGTADTFSADNKFEDTTFAAVNGSIRLLNMTTMNAKSNVTLRQINISFNRAFLNSSNITYFNLSGQVRLNSIPFSDPKVQVDTNDDGVFADCLASQCTETGYNNGEFSFDVTHFTTFQAAEAASSCANISTNTVLSNSLNSSGTCINITADNIELDCAGFSIGYANSVPAVGINTSGRTGVIIRNCRVFAGNSTVAASDGITLRGSVRTRIIDSNISSVSGVAIRIDSAHNISVINTTAEGNSSNGILIADSRNNTFERVDARSQSAAAISITTTLSPSANNTFINTTGISNSSNGLSIASSSDTRFINGSLTSHNGTALLLSLSTINSTFVGNTITSMTGIGADVQSSSRNISFVGNTFYSNNSNALLIQASNITVFGNTFSANGSAIPLSLSNGDNNIIANNTLFQPSNGQVLGLSNSDNNIIINNSINSTLNSVFFWSSGNGNRVENNNLSSIAGNGLEMSSGERNTIILNTIETRSGGGITLSATSPNNVVLNNTITSNSSVAFSISSSANTTVAFNTLRSNSSFAMSVTLGSLNNITSNTLVSTTGMALFLNNAQNDSIVSNTITSNASIGIQVQSSAFLNITSNTITGNATGIGLTLAYNNTFSGNDISVSGDAIAVGAESQNNSFTNNIATSTQGNGVRIRGNSMFNQFTGDNFSTTSANGITIDDANNNTFTGIRASALTGTAFVSQTTNFTRILGGRLSSNRTAIQINQSAFNTTFSNIQVATNLTWILADLGGYNTTITNITFETANGSIRTPGTVVATNGSRANITNLNITHNRAHINSNTLSYLNTSSQITLFNITFAAPRMRVDLEDDGTFLTCSPPQCVNQSYNNGVFVFNVSRFTTYQTADVPSTCGTLTTDTTLTDDVSSSGTCFIIGADQITLDCAGYLVNYSTSVAGHGVNVSGRSNVTIQNCRIIQSANDVSTGRGISFSGTSNSRLLNNIVVVNDTQGLNSAIALESSSSNNYLLNNSASSDSAAGILIASASNTNNLTNNSAYSNSSAAISITNGASNILIGNNASANSAFAFLIQTNSNNLTGNTARSRSGRAYRIAGSLNRLYDNFGFSNTSQGIEVTTESNILVNNTGISNTSQGILLTSSGTSNLLINNTGNSSSSIGISVATARNNLTDNKAYSNTSTAISISGTNNLLIGNSAVISSASLPSLDIAASHNVLILNNATSTSSAPCFRITGAQNNTVLNSTADCFSGIAMSMSASADYNNLSFNIFNSTSGSGLNLDSSHNFLLNNTIKSNTSTGAQLSSSAVNNTLLNNSISTNSGTALQISSSHYNNFSANTIHGNSAAAGLNINSGNNNVFTHNTFTSLVLRSTLISNTAQHNIFDNNSFIGLTDNSVRLSIGPTNNTFINSYIVSNNSLGLSVNLAENNTFINTTILSNNSWVQVNANGNNFSRLTFLSSDGAILLNSTSGQNFSADLTNLNISQNRAFLNSSANPALNSSATITLNNLAISNPRVQVDYEDDGSFVDCNAPDCVNVSYNNGVFVFNVSHFTTFQAAGGAAECGTISTSTTLIGNVSSDGTCFTITGDNVLLDCAGFNITYAQSTKGNGINATNRLNITIQNCIVTQANNSHTQSDAIRLLRTNRSSILNNNATSGNNHGIILESSSNNTAANNTAISNTSDAIGIGSASHNNQILNNKAISNTVTGAYVFQSTNNTLIQNVFTSNTNSGLYVQESTNNRFIANNATSDTEVGISFDASSANIFINNTFNTTRDTAIIFYTPSQNNTLNGTTIHSNSTWIRIDTNSTGNNLTNTRFENSNGSITIINTTTLIPGHNIHIRNLNITFNRAFLNSSNLTFLNTSGQITLNNITFTNPRVQVDYEDDGSFVNCNAPDCVNVSYNNGVFVFNSSHFTTFQAAESPITCGTIITNTNLTENVNSTGTCFIIAADNIVLDCAGNQIIYDTSGLSTLASPSYGIVADGRRNISITNCIIKDAGVTNTSGEGIRFNLTNSSNISLSTINISSGVNGINFIESVDVVVSANTVQAGDNAIKGSRGSHRASVTNNYVIGRDDGVQLDDSNNSIITSNTLLTNIDNGVEMDNSSLNLIINNSINATNDGVSLVRSTLNNITRNTLNGTDDGVQYSTNSLGNLIYQNAIYAIDDGVSVPSTSSHNGIILENNITTTGLNADCIDIEGSDLTLIDQNRLTCSDDGVALFPGVTDTNATNNIITATADGVQYESSATDNRVINNTIVAVEDGVQVFSTSSHRGIIALNTINATEDCVDIDGSDNSIIANNTLLCTDNGIELSVTSTATTIANNSVTSTLHHGISIDNSPGNNLTHNTITTQNNETVLLNRTQNATFEHNTFISRNTSSVTLTTSSNNTFRNNTLANDMGTSILFAQRSLNNTLLNNTLKTNSTWLLSDAQSGNNTIEQTTFDTQNGSIQSIPFSRMPTQTNVSIRQLNITFNRAFLNSSNNNLTFLNVSAQITLHNITLTNPRVFADFNDDGTFERCGAPVCINTSYANNVFVFNVSHFTTFEVQATNETVVNINTGERFITIQEAIDDAQTLNGHTINITGTFYSENVNVTKSLHLMGQGPSATRINSTQPNVSVINITRVDNVTISRLAITGAEATTYPPAAIWIERTNNATLRELNVNNNLLVHNRFTSPVVLYFSNFTLILNNNISNNNEGIGCEGSRNGLIKDNLISDNANQSGIWFSDCHNFTIENNTLSNNKGGTFDGGLHISFSTGFTVRYNNISNSTDGIVIRDDANNNMIIDNIISSSGANGIYINGSNHTLLINNNITNSSGRGLYIENSVNTTAINTRIIGETVEYALTAIRANTSTFNQTTIINTSRWMVLNRTNITANNLTFETGQGSISIHSAILNETNTINSSKLNISQNRAFLNSSNLSFLNTSAVITLNNITFADPVAIVDLEDDGTFDGCGTPQCSELGYSGGVFVFNVSRFTTYSSAQNFTLLPANITVTKNDIADPIVNTTQINYTILLNNSGTGTAINVTLNETYPVNSTFVNASPFPTTGNNSFFLGNISAGNVTRINITINLTPEPANGSIITNIVNVTYFNESNATLRTSDIENTTFVLEDHSPPVITILGCDPNPANVTNVITCNASVTDNVAVFNASANVTLPNGTINSSIQVTNLTPFGMTVIFSFNFTSPGIQGQFNVTWTANDTSDNRAAGVNDSFIINNSVNFTPTIPNQQVQVGQSITPFDLDSFFTDPDNDTLTFSVTGTGASLITIATGGSVTITGTSAGTFTVVFSATDGINSISSNTVTITVTSAPSDGRRGGGGGGGGGSRPRNVTNETAPEEEPSLPETSPIEPQEPSRELPSVGPIPEQPIEPTPSIEQETPVSFMENVEAILASARTQIGSMGEGIVSAIKSTGTAIFDGAARAMSAVADVTANIGSMIGTFATTVFAWIRPYLLSILIVVITIAVLVIGGPYAMRGAEHLRAEHELNKQIHTPDLTSLGASRSKKVRSATSATTEKKAAAPKETRGESLFAQGLKLLTPKKKEPTFSEITIDTSLDIDTHLDLNGKKKRKR